MLVPNRNSGHRRRFATVVISVGVVGLAVLLVATMNKASSPPPEPVHQGMTLRQWIAAEPNLPVTSHEDIMSYRRTALRAMSEPAIRYLHWMITHPWQTLDQHVNWIDRLRARLPKRLQKLLPSPPPARANFMHVVIALQLIGPNARGAAPVLVRLWECNRISAYAVYNGFPLTLAELGDASPEVLATLHRHFNSSDRLHRALCAFAAWRLDPNDSQAIAVVRHELASTDPQTYVRGALLDTFGRYGANAEPFLAEIRALIAGNATEDSAKAAWRILKMAEPAKQIMQQLATAAARPGATADDANRFAGSALSLAEVPGVSETAMPVLKELSHFTDASAASFASSILTRLQARMTNGPGSFPE